MSNFNAKKWAKPSVFWASMLLTCLSIISRAQSPFIFASKPSRDSVEQHFKTIRIPTAFANPLSNRTEAEWMQAFWPMQLMQYRSAFTDEKIAAAWADFENRSTPFKKALLEMSYGLYPQKFGAEATVALQKTNDGTLFIRLAEYLLQAQGKQRAKPIILAALNKNFFTTSFIGFDVLRKRLEDSDGLPLPPMNKLLDTGFLPGETLIFSIHRKSRNHAGLVLIRKPDGQLLRHTNGSIFSTTQLARSLSGYPFYLTNGNTPQGLFRFTGYDTSEKRYIGPTTNLQLVMPNEVLYNGFFSDTLPENRAITYADYMRLLPDAWKQYDAVYESLYAGTIGRTEIIMHGTTIPPNFYKGKTYWPQTPSMGCLCSYEEWDEGGNLVKSNQALLATMLMQQGIQKGYVLVINLNDEPKPVQLTEAMKAFGLAK